MSDELQPSCSSVSSLPDMSAEASLAKPLAKPVLAPPRVWTVFAVFVLATISILAVQMLVGAVLAAVFLSQGRELNELISMLMTPTSFILVGTLSQGVLLAAVVLAAYLSPQPLRERLGLARTEVPAGHYALVAVGSWIPGAIGLVLAYSLALVLAPDESVRALYQQMTWTVAPFFLLFITLVPAVVEEIFFRGYVQRRLLERWSPWAAILTSSVLFALLHFMPHQVLFAFPLGVWLGWLAWRTGSIWPGVACHAFVNCTWNIWHIGHQLAGLPETPPMGVIAAIILICLGCFLASCWVLRGRSQILTGSDAKLDLVTATSPD